MANGVKHWLTAPHTARGHALAGVAAFVAAIALWGAGFEVAPWPFVGVAVGSLVRAAWMSE